MKKFLITTAFCLLALMAVEVNAQQNVPAATGGNVPVNVTLGNPFRGTDGTLLGLFNAIVNRVLLPIGSIVAVVAFIYSGFLFVMAQGAPDKLKTAKSALLYTSIGTALLLGASVLATVITNTVNSLR